MQLLLILSLVTAAATPENVSGTSTFQNYESQACVCFGKRSNEIKKARINERCVGLAKVGSRTSTREPIKSTKHLIPVKRCNWLIGSPRRDADY